VAIKVNLILLLLLPLSHSDTLTCHLSFTILIKSCIVFAGKDASRALAKSSLKAEDCVPEWEDLPESEKKTLNDWITFFSKRYNIVGVVEGASNMG